MRILALAFIAPLLVACTKQSEEGGGEVPAKTGSAKTTAKSGDAPKTEAKKKTKADSNKPPRPELLPEPRERRLHPATASASSFLWNDWNKFQENYHPLYLVDDDPRTAWVEGVEGNGEGEWIQLDTSRALATTKVRLRLRNGYHKSKRLFGLNSRAKTIDVTLLPSKTKKRFELADSMDWSELYLGQPEGPLEAVRIEIVATYPGSKWQDLCLSDLEIFATSKNPENPEFEKSKLERVRAWKKERVDAAKFYGSEQARKSPLLAGYVTTLYPEGEEPEGLELKLDQKIIDEATAAFEDPPSGSGGGRFPGWMQMTIKPASTKRLPRIDGIGSGSYDHFEDGMWYADEDFVSPITDKLAFLRAADLSAIQAKNAKSVDDTANEDDKKCRRGTEYFFVAKDHNGPIRELLVVACGYAEQREGIYHWKWLQLLHYDDKGHLVALFDAMSQTELYWSGGNNAKIIGGTSSGFHGLKMMKPRREAKL